MTSEQAVPTGYDYTSPSGELELSFVVDDQQLLHKVSRRGVAIIEPSPLCLAFGDGPAHGGVIVGASAPPSERRFAIDQPAGKRRQAEAIATVASFDLSVDGRLVSVEVAVFDDAAAYRIIQLDALSPLSDDGTVYQFPDESRKFAQAYDRVGLVQPASEALYSGPVPAGFAFPQPEGWSLPLLVDTPGGWALLAESGVGPFTHGTRLLNEIDDPKHRLAGPPDDQFDGPIVEPPTGPHALPWRVLITHRDLEAVVRSCAVELLAPASAIDDTSWIRPGRVAWSWWSDSDSPRNPDTLERFIDFAAEVGWEYFLIDANWNQMPDGTIEHLVAYASARDVGLFLWYNSGGQHNRVTEEPRDRMHDRERRRAELAWLADTGIAGIKVDFFQSDRASMNRLALELLADAADARLLMNLHGITSPKGWHATWPHLLTTEAVRGAEQYKFDPWFPLTAPRHNTLLAFTRNVVGPMDYTPMTLSDVDFPHRTTNAHELALGVVFESGLQHPADSPESYRALGSDGLDLLRRLPAVWDDVWLLDGEPGSHAVFARRHGSEWWVGAINGTEAPLTVTVDLAMLGGGSWRIARDGAGPRDVVFDRTEAATLDIEMARVGGFVVWPELG